MISGQVSSYINLAVIVVAALAGATAQFTTLLGEGPTQKLMAGLSLGAIILGALNTGLHQAGGTGVAPPAGTTPTPTFDFTQKK